MSAEYLYLEALERFRDLFEQAEELDVREPAAMSLATCEDNQPTVRIVLLRGFDERGFCFYTNSHSDKGGQLAANPAAALCFYWDALQRQVRIEGSIEQVTEAESDAYWNNRRRESQLASVASDQSSELPDRETYLTRVKALEAQHEGQPVPRPAHWLGYRVVPDRIEFWTSGDARMHEREVYEAGDEGWRKFLLYP